MPEFMTMEPNFPVPADEKTLMLALGISPMEARFVQAMLNTNKWIGQEELPEVKYSTRQVIYRLRMKLEARNRKIWIINDGNGRYSIPPACKALIKREIEKVLA